MESYPTKDSNATRQYALSLLQQMIGQDKDFRPGQWEAVEAVAIKKQRALVVQRTGWGKSLVYFLTTKILREHGAGPTLLISPLLSLMRNQIEMARKIGIRAVTINSANYKEWPTVEDALIKDTCDLILISPERLNNDRFLRHILPKISGRIGLFVVDEAHCISDWGHDFRPDYRRVGQILKTFPQNTPVLFTTATANMRVVSDIKAQVKTPLTIFRGSLARESLRLQNLYIGRQAERLAWLAKNLSLFRGSGIIYCQTVQDTERVTRWLKHKGYNAAAYHAQDEVDKNRSGLEISFLENKIKILVATVALGMGFDKPDIAFIIHYQRPSSVTHYYQQVGRAGRGIEKSYGILLWGDEDEDIQKFLINNSIPARRAFHSVLSALQSNQTMTIDQILSKVNHSPGMVQRILKLLTVEGAVIETCEGRERLYCRIIEGYQEDFGRIKQYIDLRWKEWYEINRYTQYNGCLMEYLQRALNDTTAQQCQRCANCQQKGFTSDVPADLVIEAEDFLKECSIVIKPKDKAPGGLINTGVKIPPNLKNYPGQSLSYYGDAGWGQCVKNGKYQKNYFADELVTASVHLILIRWRPNPFPQWVAAIPSKRHPNLVADFAKRLAECLNIPFIPVLERKIDAPQQKLMMNDKMQAKNVIDTIKLNGPVPRGDVLLVDDIIDSGWTLTMAGYLLRSNGSGIVYPFTLAQATGRHAKE